jgi:hypothetical protein
VNGDNVAVTFKLPWEQDGAAVSYWRLGGARTMRTKPLTDAEKKLVDSIRSQMPNYRFGESYFVKARRSNDSITDRASGSSSDLPSDSRSDKTE